MATEEEKRLKLAFNAGYLLNSSDPKLLDNILAKNKDSELVKVMIAGKQQAQREKIQAQQMKIKEQQKEKKHKR